MMVCGMNAGKQEGRAAADGGAAGVMVRWDRGYYHQRWTVMLPDSTADECVCACVCVCVYEYTHSPLAHLQAKAFSSAGFLSRLRSLS